MKLLAILSLSVILSACQIINPVDVKKLNDLYCAEISEHYREKLIGQIREHFPKYPDGGLCSIEADIKKLLDK